MLFKIGALMVIGGIFGYGLAENKYPQCYIAIAVGVVGLILMYVSTSSRFIQKVKDIDR